MRISRESGAASGSVVNSIAGSLIINSSSLTAYISISMRLLGSSKAIAMVPTVNSPSRGASSGARSSGASMAGGTRTSAAWAAKPSRILSI